MLMIIQTSDSIYYVQIVHQKKKNQPPKQTLTQQNHLWTRNPQKNKSRIYVFNIETQAVRRLTQGLAENEQRDFQLLLQRFHIINSKNSRGFFLVLRSKHNKHKIHDGIMIFFTVPTSLLYLLTNMFIV